MSVHCHRRSHVHLSLQEAEKLEPGEDSSNFTCYDYSEKRSLPITIPDYNYMERNGDRFVVFNIYMAGR